MCVCAYERERKLCVPFHVPEQRDGIRSQSLRCGPGMRRGGSLGALNWSCGAPIEEQLRLAKTAMSLKARLEPVHVERFSNGPVRSRGSPSPHATTLAKYCAHLSSFSC